MLNVAIKTTDPDLTTTGALKQRLFGSSSDATLSDAVAGAIVRSASRWAEGFVGYPLVLQTYEETFPTYGTRNAMVARTPFRSGRVYESTDVNAFEITSTMMRVEDREAGILSREDGWPWTVPTQLELEDRPLPGQESQPWYAVYQAGYTYNGLSTDSNHYSTHAGSTDTGRTLPEDIEEAVLLKCRSIYEQSFEGGGVESEQLGDISVKYRSGGDGRAGASEAEGFGAPELLLAPYRRVV